MSDDDERDSGVLGPTEDYHDGEHPGDCPGTCDYCGFWLCPHADEVARCDYPDGNRVH